MRTRLLLLATMLTVATACDKKGTGQSAFASRPNVLLQVFGSAGDPRAVPVAFLDSAGPRSMELSPAEWRQFDSLYMRGGDSLTVYSQGKVVGSARVQRGMWEGEQPLYSLPGCSVPVPRAAVRVAVDAAVGNLVELLATTAPLREDTTRQGRSMGLGPAQVQALARVLAVREAQAMGIPAAALDSLDYRALAANTGATRGPTVITSYVDRRDSDAARRGAARHIFLVADEADSGWVVTYRSVHARAGRDVPLRRYVDRLDLTGDGIAEIVLEEWTLGGQARPLVLRWQGAGWEELWRGRPDPCVAK